MSFNNSLCKAIKIYQKKVTVLYARSRKYQIIRVVAHRNNIVFLSLLKFESIDGMLNLHCKQIHNKHFIIKSNNDLILSYTNWFYCWLKGQISDYSLCIYQKSYYEKVLSSKMASFYGGAKGVYLKPTKASKLLLLTIYTICNGAPKSLDCLRRKG